MIPVSDSWKDIQQRFLLPETFVEIDCTISEVGAQESATIVGTDEAVFSHVDSVLTNAPKTVKYATNELNFWALDGTRTILPDSGSDAEGGYVSNTASTGSVIISFPEVHTVASSGVTITWSSAYGEYPSVFTVTAKNGGTIVAETTIIENTKQVCDVFLRLENYDSIEISVHNWGLPDRRVRIEKVVIGHVLTLTKDDILSFKHEQTGDLLSGELPKYSIEFTLDNSDGRWDPNNPTGMEKYLSERQQLTVRYGMEVNGATEWINAGTFYLSEWNTPSNGLEARFVARDVFEFLLNADVTGGSVTGNLGDIVEWATTPYLPNGVSVVTDSVLADSDSRTPTITGTAAEVVQKCANASCCILRYDRGGTLYIEQLDQTLSDYRITSALSYSHPEITLSKPLKTVSVSYGGETPYEFTVSNVGEKQTATNDFILTEGKASDVASWVSDILKSRKTVRGEFRADPRLDLFDVVVVESKYGVLSPVVITNITYTFNGSFRGSYTGRVLEVATE